MKQTLRVESLCLLKESDGRGLKDPEGYKRKIGERERAEERARAAGGGPEGGGLKVGQQRAKAAKSTYSKTTKGFWIWGLFKSQRIRSVSSERGSKGNLIVEGKILMG